MDINNINSLTNSKLTMYRKRHLNVKDFYGFILTARKKRGRWLINFHRLFAGQFEAIRNYFHHKIIRYGLHMVKEKTYPKQHSNICFHNNGRKNNRKN